MKTNYWIGIITGFGLGCLYFLIPTFVSGFKTQPAEAIPESSRFKVVDNYKGCDVIQWSDNQMATYKYFLHCPK